MTSPETETTRAEGRALQAKRLRAFSELGLGLALRPRGELAIGVEAPLLATESPWIEAESLSVETVSARGETESARGETESARGEAESASSGTESKISAKFPTRSLHESFPIRQAEVRMALSSNIGTLEALQEQVAECEACGLCKGRTQTVFAAGNPLASLAIVGEAPGAEEDRIGQAFVGPAGKLLDGMLASMGLDRAQDAYICNVLKCRPPNNRDPSPEEVAKCEPFLQNQLNLVQPKMILVLGRFAAQSLLRTEASIASLRGRLHAYSVGGREVPVVVTYHPAYLLRNLADKSKTWADLCFLQSQMGRVSGA